MPKKDRPSPSESATLFKTGTIKLGNDGNNWIVVLTSSGTHRWQKLKDEEVRIPKKEYKGNKNTFQFTDIGRVKKIGSINITKKVGVGDFMYNELNLKKGIYTGYKVDDNLLFVDSKYKVNKDWIRDIVWNKCSNDVYVDSGHFGFFDTEIVEMINELDPKYNKKKKNLPFMEYPFSDADIVTTEMLDYKFSSKLPQDLIKLKFGIVSDTGTGDGQFFCYTSGNDKAFLMGGFTTINVYEDEELPGGVQYYKSHIK